MSSARILSTTLFCLFGSVLRAELPPTALTAEALSTTSVKLKWEDNSSKETGYRVEFKRSSVNSWGAALTVEKNVTVATKSALSPGTSYDFRVRGLGSGMSARYSNVATASTWTLIPPPPSNLTAKLDGLAVILTWGDRSPNESCRLRKRLSVS